MYIDICQKSLISKFWDILLKNKVNIEILIPEAPKYFHPRFTTNFIFVKYTNKSLYFTYRLQIFMHLQET